MSLKRFFNKQKLNYKFKKLGEGRSLNFNPQPPNTHQIHDEPTEERQVSSEASRKAAEAAINRLAAKDHPTMSIAHRKIEVEIANEQRQIKHGEELLATRELGHMNLKNKENTKKVLFWCPNLFGDTVVLPYSEMEVEIDNFLQSMMQSDPAESATLSLIRGIYASQLPSNSDTPSDSTPTLSEIHDKRRHKFITLLKNIIEFPEKETYRQLRVSNVLISDLLSIKGAVNFFEICGFVKTPLPDPKVSPDANEQAVMIDYLVLPINDAQNLQHLEVMLELLQTAEPIMAQLYRNTILFGVSDSQSRCLEPTRDELPSEFFTLSCEDIQKIMLQQKQAMETSRMLLTKAMRERQKTREQRFYRYVLIRIRVPGNLVLQGTFGVSENMNDVCLWLESCLVDETVTFKIWSPLGLCQTSSANQTSRRTELTDRTSSLLTLGLAPCSLLILTADEDSSSRFEIKPELINKMQHFGKS